ncbi:ash family protein, partial [Escherichia coli]|nr:ash family protein [Escherichia coli]
MSKPVMIDSDNSGRYIVLAAAKSVAGIGVPEFSTAHNRAKAVFLCAMQGYIQIMVGRAGASKDAPVSVEAGYANPVRFTTSQIGVCGGDCPNHSTG